MRPGGGALGTGPLAPGIGGDGRVVGGVAGDVGGLAGGARGGAGTRAGGVIPPGARGALRPPRGDATGVA